MKRTISIIGPIGKFSYKGIEYNGVQPVDVISQVSKYSDTTELTVEIASDGGSVEVAKVIRGYLKNLQPRIQVTTKQVGDIASAGTILFSAGKNRLAAKGINPSTGKPFQFMVHNPWLTHTEGDASALERDAADLRATEDELAAIYTEDTGIDKQSIMPLMKAESYFDAQKAVDLKFATATYTALNQAAYNMTKVSKPAAAADDDSEGLVDALLALLGKKKKKVASAPPPDMVGKAIMVDGVAAVDGVYTVIGGVITAVAAAADAGAAPGAAPADVKTAPAATAAKAEIDELKKEIAALKKAQAKKAADDDDDEDGTVAKLLAEVAALKKATKTKHTPASYDPATKVDDAKEWDRSFKAGEHALMRKNEPEKYKRLYFAKYGKEPNI